MSTTRTARFVQNTLSTALYQLTAMVMGFITPRLMILYYGSEINGLIVSVTEFLTYFKMLEAGLAASVNVALYEPLARRDHQAVSGIASAARLFYNAAGWMFTGLTVAFTIAYPFFVPVRDLNGLPVSHLSVMVLILAMGLSGMLEFFTMARFRVLIAAAQRAYFEVTGDAAPPFTSGGGTYSRLLKNAITFGVIFPGERPRPEGRPATHGSAHGPDEFTYIPDLLRAAEIYALAIVLLDEVAGEAGA